MSQAFFGFNPSDLWNSLRGVFSLRYNDKPYSERVYRANAHWFKWIYEYYFKIQHYGAIPSLRSSAKKEKVLVLSNHANTLEALSIYYYFHLEKLGDLRALVFREAFRIPFFRELFRSGRAVPINVPEGAKALEDSHILIFPEGMDFVKRYEHFESGFRFHAGFLRIAKKFLEAGHSRLTIVPVAHDGFDAAIKFWVINNSYIVKKIIKPLSGYPYAIWPKFPFLLPAKVVFLWGKPISISLNQINSEKKIKDWQNRFELEMNELYREAKELRKKVYP